MSTIRKRKNNWQVIIRLKGYPAIYKTFSQKHDAKTWALENELKLKREEAGIIKIKYPSFKDIALKYIREVSIIKKTYRDERYTILSLCREPWSAYPLNRITPLIVSKYRDKQIKLVSGSTINRRLDVVSNIFTICTKEWGYPVKNPVLSIRRPKKTESRSRVLSQEEVLKLLSDNSLSIELRQIIIVALETGMRKSEILSIKREHIKGNLLHIPVAKTKSRTIPLTKLAQKTLLESHIPYRINVNTLGHTWRRLMRKHRLNDVCFHDLRHTALTNLFLKKSLTVPEVMLISGHSDPRILLKTYTNLKAQDLVEKKG